MVSTFYPKQFKATIFKRFFALGTANPDCSACEKGIKAMWDRELDNPVLYKMDYEIDKDKLCVNHPDNPSCEKKLNDKNDPVMKDVLKNVILAKETTALACKIMPGACDKER